MIEESLPIPPHLKPTKVPAAIEAACHAAGLTVTQTTTLAMYPGSHHWHFKLGRQPGTLEITWWPAKRQAWFKVAAGRQGQWIKAAQRQVRQQLTSIKTSEHV